MATTWKFYTKTPDAIEAMLKACEQARESIYFEQFIFNPDAQGQKFVDILIKKSLEGLTVKCVFDAMAGYSLSTSNQLKKMLDAGIKVKFFNWMTPYSKYSKKLLFFRNHRRSLIIDRSTLFTGGICIGERMTEWRDTHLKIDGSVVSQAVYVFDQTWKRVYKRRSLGLGNQSRTGLDNFSYITQAPLLSERHLYYRLIETIRHAQKRVWLTTPYFLPDHKLLRALVLAKRRGVDVKIILPKSTDHPLVSLGCYTYLSYFLSKKVKILMYREMIHAKTAVIDDDWAMVGSLNLDNVSLRYNFESAVISTERLFVDELSDIFKKDCENAPELTIEEWRARPLMQRIAEKIVWPIRKFL